MSFRDPGTEDERPYPEWIPECEHSEAGHEADAGVATLAEAITVRIAEKMSFTSRWTSSSIRTSFRRSCRALAKRFNNNSESESVLT